MPRSSISRIANPSTPFSLSIAATFPFIAPLAIAELEQRVSAAEMAAVSFELLTTLVGRGLPFQNTVAPTTNFVPFTVRVKAGPPAVALAGLRLVIVGTGLLMGKGTGLEVPPPGEGLKAVTLAVPAEAMSAAAEALGMASTT